MQDATKSQTSRLAAKRRSLGWTQVELARAANLSQTHISALERGVYLPSLRDASALAALLGTTPMVLWPEAFSAPAAKEG